MKNRFRIIGLISLLFGLAWGGWKYYEWENMERDPIKLARQLAADVERQTGKSPFAPPAVEMPSAPAKTNNAYSLPPDPGFEGTKTVLGIDVNNNGVRDDTERFIVQEYGESERVREALFDYARVHQDWLVVTERQAALAAAQKLNDAMDCVRFALRGELLPNGVDKWIQASREVEALKINTSERARNSQKTDELLAGYGSDGREADGSTCTFDPKSLKN